ncbi:hypothetical protein BU26DRAFT_171006 [Trematosphaeria pertusa]|uniref:Uncharacterized protein n=1 Tax=Trematosphaeria pertusa TaxID=390896 RepID=A0A6A6HUZ2_9PLEO|nr:uncharacterized protein BU26DRAFT_171006 [Trematosphaeria pertusa]KAF2241831.1 hypothetical protein BU26DRAFT_171006 [Trematosphaeria pertusa]
MPRRRRVAAAPQLHPGFAIALQQASRVSFSIPRRLGIETEPVDRWACGSAFPLDAGELVPVVGAWRSVHNGRGGPICQPLPARVICSRNIQLSTDLFWWSTNAVYGPRGMTTC